MKRRFLFALLGGVAASALVPAIAAPAKAVVLCDFCRECARKAEFIEKLVRPPMVAPPELKNEPASIMPGMITYSNALNGSPNFRPAFEVNPRDLRFVTSSDFKCTCGEMERTRRDLERLQVLGQFVTP